VTPAQVRGELARLVQVLLENGALAANTSVITRVGGNEELVSWTGSGYSVLAPDQLPRIAEYRLFVATKQYTSVLSDGSLLQLSYRFRRGQIVWHRLSYHPCPVLFDPAEIQPEDDLIELVDMLLEDEVINELSAHPLAPHTHCRLRLRSPIRFDFDSGRAASGHPAVHFTVNSHHCRVPVFAPMSVGQFVGFVFKNFYPGEWAAHKAIRDWPVSFQNLTITGVEQREIHVACQGSP
jgi:hypothetical protein